MCQTNWLVLVVGENVSAAAAALSSNRARWTPPIDLVRHNRTAATLIVLRFAAPSLPSCCCSLPPSDTSVRHIQAPTIATDPPMMATADGTMPRFLDALELQLYDAMSPAFLTCIAVILCLLFRMLNVNSQALRPQLLCMDTDFLNSVYKIAPLLREPYVPTRLWGFSGHMQTVLHSIVGRFKCPWPLGERVYLSLADGSTLTYDLYQPLNEHEDDITVAICPGIGNTSESVYIRTFVHYSQCHGYRCAVLNHIGALPSVPVTASRIFTYGHTEDYAAMVANLERKFPTTKIVSVGFSLGGNLVTKYLGERDRRRPANVIGGVSICQGYNAVEGTRCLLNWQNFRRFYLYVMTENVKAIIMKHRHVLLDDDVKQRCRLNESEIAAAATLPELDEAYTRRVHNFESVREMYRWSSSVNYLKGIRQPMVFINARDDPIVPDELLGAIREHSANTPSTLYVELAHGGHLGFYEGGLIYPNPVTWLDRAVVAIIGGIVLSNHDAFHKKQELATQSNDAESDTTTTVLPATTSSQAAAAAGCC